MGTQLKPEQIHGKRLIAVAGYDIFGKQLITTINKEVEDKNILLIGINIKEDDFDFFINNLAKSKVEVTIFLPEYQEKSAKFYGLDGYLIACYKKDGELKFLTENRELYIDDRSLMKVVNKIVEDI
jgi:hypothetical protein